MGTQKLALLIFILSLCSSCSFDTERTESLESQLFKEYALAICLGSAFDEPSISSDANKAANGFMEFGNMPLEAYDSARSLVDIWIKKDYSSKAGSQIQIMKCIDFHQSLELSELYTKYSPCNSAAGWLDPEDYKRQCQ